MMQWLLNSCSLTWTCGLNLRYSRLSLLRRGGGNVIHIHGLQHINWNVLIFKCLSCWDTFKLNFISLEYLSKSMLTHKCLLSGHHFGRSLAFILHNPFCKGEGTDFALWFIAVLRGFSNVCLEARRDFEFSVCFLLYEIWKLVIWKYLLICTTHFSHLY